MAWNPYTDQKNRAYSGILTSIFPEQTKTVPRIILWSIIFLLDLILGIGGAAYFGVLSFGNYRNTDQMKLAAGLVLAGILVVFWLQGKIWYGMIRFFRKRKELD